MSKIGSKKERLIDSATQLFHTKGISNTSLQHIAGEAEVPIGNVYYYFKTKEEMGIAAAKKRMHDLEERLKAYDANHQKPLDRMIESLKFYEEVKEPFMKYGCPAAVVCQERLSEDCNIGKEFAKLFDKAIEWYSQKFQEAGYSEDESDKQALQIQIRIQGAGIMAKVKNDCQIISNEVVNLIKWLQGTIL